MKMPVLVLLLIAAILGVAACAGVQTPDRRVSQTGCRTPGVPPDLKASGKVGSVLLRFRVAKDGKFVADSAVVLSASDSGLVDSAWAVVRSCQYLPAIIKGRATAQRETRLVQFNLPAGSDHPSVTPVVDELSEEWYIGVDYPDPDAPRRLRLMESYSSVGNIVGGVLETIAIFLGIALSATRLSWRRPVLIGFGVTTTLAAAMLLMVELDIYEPTSVAATAGCVAVSLLGAALTVGAAAWTFKALGERTAPARVAGATLAGLIAAPGALLLTFLAASIIGLGSV